jgi:hypothetical protein
MSLVPHDRSQSLPEAFVGVGTRLGEKQEQSKNKNGILVDFYQARARQGATGSRRQAAAR